MQKQNKTISTHNYNFGFLINLIKQKYTNKIAFCEGNKQITFIELKRIVDSWVDFFAKENISNEKIVLKGELNSDWILTFFGIVCSGNMAILLDDSFAKATTEYAFQDASVLCSDHNCNIGLANDLKFVNYSKMNQLFKDGYANTQIEERITVISDEKCAVIAFSSGTTGFPKPIKLTHKNIVSDILHCKNIFGDLFGENDIVVPVLPATHLLGLTVGLLVPLYYGARICFAENGENKVYVLQRFKPTTLIVVPAIIEAIYSYIEYYLRAYNMEKFEAVRNLFPNLKYIVCGSAYLKEETEKYFEDMHIQILYGYGTTECSPVVTCNNNTQRKHKSVGKIFQSEFCDVRIIDGEIAVTGNIVARDCCKNVDGEDFFFTGDTGYIDKDGFLFVVGRKDNVLVLDNGYKIVADEMEQLILNEINDIKDVKVCLMFDDKTKSNMLTVIIVPKNYTASEDKIFEAVKSINDRFLNQKRIRKVIIQKQDFKYNYLHKKMN